NRRVANWGVNTNSGVAAPDWQFVTVTGTASSSRLYVYLTSAGEVFLDDIRIVAGASPGAGANYVQNGDFESPLTPPWNVSTNHLATVIDPTRAHSGSASLHLIASSGGSSQTTAVWQDTGPV